MDFAERSEWIQRIAGQELERKAVAAAAAGAGRLGHTQEQRKLLKQVDDLDAAIVADRFHLEELTGESAPPRPNPSADSLPVPASDLDFAASVHEVAHALALREFGGTVERIELHANGGGRVLGTPPKSVRDQLVCIAVGEEAEKQIVGMRFSAHDCSADRSEFARVAEQLEPFERYNVQGDALEISTLFVQDRTADIRLVGRVLQGQRTMTGNELARLLGQQAAPQQRAAPASAGRVWSHEHACYLSPATAAQTTGRPLTRREHDELAVYAKELMSGMHDARLLRERRSQRGA